MTRSKPALLIVFLALLAAVIWLLAKRSGRETFRPVFSADSTAFHRIEIANADTSITFMNQEGIWRIVSPIKWDVEKNRFRQFMREVILAEFSTESVATGQEALKKYDLTKDKALRIKAYDSRDKLLREVWFGDPGNPLDYFCYPSETEVYQAGTKVVTLYGPELEPWRSPYALSLQPDQLLSIKVDLSGSGYELTRAGELWHYRDKQENFDIPAGNLTLAIILNDLSGLGAPSLPGTDELPPPNSEPTADCAAVIKLQGNSDVSISFHSWKGSQLLKIDRYPDSYFLVDQGIVTHFAVPPKLFMTAAPEPPSP